MGTFAYTAQAIERWNTERGRKVPCGAARGRGFLQLPSHLLGQLSGNAKPGSNFRATIERENTERGRKVSVGAAPGRGFLQLPYHLLVHLSGNAKPGSDLRATLQRRTVDDAADL